VQHGTGRTPVQSQADGPAILLVFMGS
jgi:hypothetical protein